VLPALSGAAAAVTNVTESERPPWPSDEMGIRYLLGTLDDPDLSRLEEALTEDEELQERLDALEAELVDRYVGGRLGLEDRSSFERRYLSEATGRNAVDFSRLLGRSLSGSGHRVDPSATSLPAAPRRRTWLTAAAVAVFAVSSLVGLSWWKSRRDVAAARDEVARLRAALAAASAGAPTSTPEIPKSPPPVENRPAHALSAPAEVVVALLAGGTRGPNAGQTFSVPPGAHSVRLLLRTAVEPQQQYRAVVLTPDGLEVWRGEDLPIRLRGSAPAVDLAVPASRLVRGDYVVRLSSRQGSGSWESLAEFVFSVRAAGDLGVAARHDP